MNPDARLLSLAYLTEAPLSRLRCVDPAHLSDAERCARVALAFAEVLQEVLLEDDELIVAERLAALTEIETAAIDAMLLSLDMTALRRRLQATWTFLTRNLAQENQDVRTLAIAERRARRGRALSRLAFGSGDSEDRSQHRLLRTLATYLDSHRASVPDWIPLVQAQKSSPPSSAAPVSARVFLRGGVCTAGKHLFIFRQYDAEPLLDAWLSAQRAATWHAGAQSKRITTIREACGDNRRRTFDMPQGSAVGKLNPGRDARIPDYRQLCGPGIDAILDALAEDFEWVIFPWPHTMQEAPLAWLGGDARLADTWESLLRQHHHGLLPISSYRQFDTLTALAGGVQFGESGDYGEAALVAARDEPWLPLLVADIPASCWHGWRRWTARLHACAIGRCNDGSAVRVVYRVNDADAFRALWAAMDHSYSISTAVVSGRDDPAQVLASFDVDRYTSGLQTANCLSARHGWVYDHVFGGGADEHHAVFHAQDPAITQRVAAFATAQPGWYMSGFW